MRQITETRADFEVAALLAADLAGAQVDPSEVQKTLAFLRSRQGDGKALFTYLDAVLVGGSAVIRSGRTVGYYRDISAACRRHLRPLQDDYEKMLQTFAWSARLLRYYRAVPWAAEAKARDQQAEAPEPVKTEPARTAGPTIPEVGETIRGRILAVDETAALIEIAGFAPEKAVAVLKAEHMEGKRFREGNAATVDVTGVRTTKSGRVIVEVKAKPKV